MNFSLNFAEPETGKLTLAPEEFVFVHPGNVLSYDPTLDLEKGAPVWMPETVQRLLQKSSSEPILKGAYGKGQAILTAGFSGKLSMHDLPPNFRARASAVIARDSGIAIKPSGISGLGERFLELHGFGQILIAARGDLILIHLDFDQSHQVSAHAFLGLSGQASVKVARNSRRLDQNSVMWTPAFHTVTGPGTIWMQSQSEPVPPGHFSRAGKR